MKVTVLKEEGGEFDVGDKLQKREMEARNGGRKEGRKEATRDFKKNRRY